MIGLGLWLPTIVAAAAIGAPPGWVEGSAATIEAQSRAKQWAYAAGGGVQTVMSPGIKSGSTATLAVIDVPMPIPLKALIDHQRGHAWLMQRVTQTLGPRAELDAQSVKLAPLSQPQSQPGLAVLSGRVSLGARRVRIAIAPTGAHHRMVILLVPRSEEVLYINLFDQIVGSQEGLRLPIAPFAKNATRWTALMLWLVVGGAFTILWTRHCLAQFGPRVAGRQVAAVLAGVALLSTAIIGVMLTRVETTLGLVETTPWQVATEVGAMGLLAALLSLIITETWEQRLGPIASAPTAGSFAMARPTAPLEQSLRPIALRPPPAAASIAAPAPTISAAAEPSIDRAPSSGDLTALRPIRSGDPSATVRADRTASGASDGVASLIDAHDPIDDRIQPREAMQSGLFPLIHLDPRPSASDRHPALDAPLPSVRPREDSA